jgi:hypothetical protein
MTCHPKDRHVLAAAVAGGPVEAAPVELCGLYASGQPSTTGINRDEPSSSVSNVTDNGDASRCDVG